MFDIGWTELLVIGVVALIVIGPKDLPEMFRTVGRFTARARSMARDFQRAMEAAADETGVKDVAKDLKTIASPHSMGLNAVKDAATKFEKWDPLKTSKPAPASIAKPVSPALQPAAPVAPLGPATQALADATAAKRAALAEMPSAGAGDGGPGPALSVAPPLPTVAEPAATEPPKKVAARKPKPPAVPEQADAGDAAKPARKPRTRKTDA